MESLAKNEILNRSNLVKSLKPSAFLAGWAKLGQAKLGWVKLDEAK
jgi:hypothetical protein